MANKSGIQWTDDTWNPLAGCSLVSPGCTNCYAMKVAHRLARISEATGAMPQYRGTTKVVNGHVVWTGKIGVAGDRIISQPFRKRAPKRIFVNSMSDLFHEDVPFEVIDRIWAVMALTSRHTYQILTKRPDRMHDYSHQWRERLRDGNVMVDHPTGQALFRDLVDWSMLPNMLLNIHLGVSAEDQKRADERIPTLLQTRAAVRFVSLEPLLGPIDLGRIHVDPTSYLDVVQRQWPERFPLGRGLDWVIVGGESGPHARPMHPDWPRKIRDQCAGAGVPYFFKQHGEWLSCADDNGEISYGRDEVHCWGGSEVGGDGACYRVGKKAAGRLLDGVEHNGMPT